MTKDAKDAIAPSQDVAIKLNFRIPSRMPSLYAHHMFVQQGENEIVIAYFEVVPPLVPPGATEEQIKSIIEAGIASECVARITVAKNRFPAFVQAMQQALEQITSEQQPLEEDSINADSSGDNQENK